MTAIKSTYALLAVFFFSTVVFGSNTGTFEAKFRSLIEQSQHSKESCNKYTSELEKLVDVEKKSDKDVFRNRHVALAVLHKLEQNPGAPLATQEAGRLIVEQPKKHLETEWFVHVSSEWQPYCALLKTYTNLRRLIEGKSRYNFTVQEQARVKHFTLRFIDTESSYPSNLISVVTQILILESLNGAGFLGEKRPFEARIKVLSNEATSLRQRVREKIDARKEKLGKGVAEDFVYEILETNKLREKVRSLYKDIQ